MTEIFNMDGYGAFVWPAWGIAFLLLGILIYTSVRTMWARERELANLEASSRRRRKRDHPPENDT